MMMSLIRNIKNAEGYVSAVREENARTATVRRLNPLGKEFKGVILTGWDQPTADVIRSVGSDGKEQQMKILT